MGQDAEIAVALVVHAQARCALRAELDDQLVDDAGLLLPLGIRQVDDVQQHVGVGQLLERGLEGLDEMRGQLADEADRVGEQDLRRLVDLETARRGVERVEQAVVRRDVRAGKAVEQGGLARVGIADETDHRHRVLLAPAALGAAHAAHLAELFLELLDLAADVAAVGLELGLAGAARADRA